MNIGLIGYGKMGKAIERIALLKDHKVVLKISTTNADELKPENLRHCDVCIEFTNPESAPGNIYACLDAGIAVVTGSTGWSHRLNEITNYASEKGGSFIYSSNFSIGVNIFFEVSKKLATLMVSRPEYDISLEEIHHTQKKDSPSGTAITLAEEIINTIPRKKNWVNKIADNDNELTITSKRVDPAPGIHSIKYSSPIDDIEITHTAHSREGFATGVIIAAEFLVNRKGIFTMKDVLNI